MGTCQKFICQFLEFNFHGKSTPSVLFLISPICRIGTTRPPKHGILKSVAWEQRLDASGKASIQPAATKVTDLSIPCFEGRLFLTQPAIPSLAYVGKKMYNENEFNFGEG